MKEIKNPLVANVDRLNGNIEISISKKYDDKEEPVFKKFMGMCAMDDKMLVDTSEMGKDQTMKACGMQYSKMRAMMNEVGKGGLTEKQKKLPPALQKAILKKMKEDGKISEEEAEAADKLLSKDEKKKEEVAPQDDMKVVENPKEPKISKAAEELNSNVKKKLTKIANELDSAVKMHTSQAERIRDMLN